MKYNTKAPKNGILRIICAIILAVIALTGFSEYFSYEKPVALNMNETNESDITFEPDNYYYVENAYVVGLYYQKFDSENASEVDYNYYIIAFEDAKGGQYLAPMRIYDPDDDPLALKLDELVLKNAKVADTEFSGYLKTLGTNDLPKLAKSGFEDYDTEILSTHTKSSKSFQYVCETASEFDEHCENEHQSDLILAIILSSIALLLIIIELAVRINRKKKANQSKTTFNKAYDYQKQNEKTTPMVSYEKRSCENKKTGSSDTDRFSYIYEKFPDIKPEKKTDTNKHPWEL
ncbi:MAG: hypothetical protein IKB73_00595 [Ruminococcus sp.]|nr:hypothetical protein [Ruminococcus sp.]